MARLEGGSLLRAWLSAPLRFARSRLETALNANVEIHARGIDDLYTFPLEVNVSTYDFDLSAAHKQALYRIPSPSAHESPAAHLARDAQNRRRTQHGRGRR